MNKISTNIVHMWKSVWKTAENSHFSDESYSYRNLCQQIVSLLNVTNSGIKHTFFITCIIYANFFHITYENYNYYCGKSTRNRIS